MLSSHSDWLAQRGIAGTHCTIHLRENGEKKMASWFALVTEEQILLINKVAGSIDSICLKSPFYFV